MKVFNINSFSSLMLCIGLLFFVSSCTDDDVFEGPDGPVDFTSFDVNYSNQGGLILISDVVTGFYDLADLDNASIGFTVDDSGEDANSVDLIANFNGQGTVLQTITSFPSSLTITLAQVLSSLGIDASAVGVGDAISFSFANLSTASGSFKSGTSLNIPVSCSSDLGGTYDYVSSNLKAENGYGCPIGNVSGQVTFEALGGGKYAVSDLGFGQYGSSCWGDSPATSPDAIISDVCNTIITGGLDQYGLVYIWVIKEVSGASLSMSWTNNYGDGGDVVITRPDGSSWPALVTE